MSLGEGGPVRFPTLYQNNRKGSRYFVMRSNRLRLIKNDGGSVRIIRARNRLIRLYNDLRNWRAVQEKCGASNVAVVYNFALHGIQPKNEKDRRACFLIQDPKPKDPYRILPKWLVRTEGALTFFNRQREHIKEMSKDTRETVAKAKRGE